jgi:glucokinase
MTIDKKIYSIGIDIGGTKMAAILFDGEKIIADSVLATPKDNIDHFLIMLKALVEPLFDRARGMRIRVRFIGLGVAGVPDSARRKILHSPNLTIIDGFGLVAAVGEMFGLPVTMDNDASCFVRAEATLGAGKKYKNVYGIIIGTGIGGGWWLDGTAYGGAHGGGGEPGQMIIDFSTKIKLEEAFHRLTQNNPGQLAEDAYRGDVLAEKTFAEVGNFLGLAFANIVNLIDPEAIVIGGGVVESSGLFLSATKKSMLANIESKEVRKNVKIFKSKLGPLSGAIGAALLTAHNS